MGRPAGAGSGWRRGLLLLLATVLAGCTAAPATPPDRTATTSAASAAGPQRQILALVTATVDAFNATAGSPVQDQQRVLIALIAPGQLATQRSCPAATRTLLMEPVYPALALAPGWRPAAGTMDGTAYSLPTVIRVFSGDRIIGTDLTDLHLVIRDGEVRWASLCVS